MYLFDFTVICVLIIHSSYSADHSTFKNCSRVDFCNNLRFKLPSYDYTLNTSTIEYPSDFHTFTAILNSKSGDPDLTFTLTILQNHSYRLKITEVGSFRYEVPEVLDREPEIQGEFGYVSDNCAILITKTDSNSLTIFYSPFDIWFNKDEFYEVIFKGDRLSFSTNTNNAPFTFGVKFPQANHLYGIHEHSETLSLRTTESNGTDPYRLKNSDVAYYEINSPMALYGAIPVLYGHGPNATAGIFLHNAAEQWIETTVNEGGDSEAYFMVETGTLDLFIFLGNTPQEVVRQYTAITGKAPVPPLWSLGYHQSRYSYATQEQVLEVATNFDSNNFQLDSIWLDIDYTDGFKYFTWNNSTFSDPKGMQSTLDSTNKKLVTIIDPHIKVENGYNVYDGALKNGYFVKNADGSVFEGQCWPGLSSYIDFLNPEARNYYASLYSYDNFKGSTATIAGIWNDMNEPSVFDTSIEMTLPADSLHIGYIKHREIHNIYGFLHTMSTYQGLLERNNNEVRPFVLTRSHFAGSQRYAAFWTGDNQADWPYLLSAIQECLNANLLGMVFCGADIGGFMGNPSSDLLERWYQAGAWLPFYRSHSTNDVDRREPYVLPEDTQPIVRSALEMRYKHIPTWYTLFYEHSVTGDPLIRPLFYQYPQDTNTFAIDNQLLVGRDILVRAVTEPGIQSLDVYFPGGEAEVWISANDKDVQVGNGTFNIKISREFSPVYYRRGGIIVRKDTVTSNTAEMRDDPYTLYYTPNDDGTASGTVYLDDGISFKYRDDVDYNYLSINVDGDSVSTSVISGNGTYEFVVDKIVRREITHLPNDITSGKYKETVFTEDVNGVPLKNINLKEKGILKLNFYSY